MALNTVYKLSIRGYGSFYMVKETHTHEIQCIIQSVEAAVASGVPSEILINALFDTTPALEHFLLLHISYVVKHL